jgi:hypothetical protein
LVGWPAAELGRVRRDPERELLATLALATDLAERVRGGRREERLLGATQLPNFLRRSGGPGWALVGDAGCHKDPYLALGVCDAFRDAELLAARSTMRSQIAAAQRTRSASTSAAATRRRWRTTGETSRRLI